MRCDDNPGFWQIKSTCTIRKVRIWNVCVNVFTKNVFFLSKSILSSCVTALFAHCSKTTNTFSGRQLNFSSAKKWYLMIFLCHCSFANILFSKNAFLLLLWWMMKMMQDNKKKHTKLKKNNLLSSRRRSRKTLLSLVLGQRCLIQD